MKHMSPTDDLIRSTLQTVRTIAVVGASNKAHRASNGVMRFLQGRGYRCIPVNPLLAGQVLLGEKVHDSLKSIGEPIDMVDVFRNPADAGPVVDEAIAIGAKVVWMQLGVINQDAAERGCAAGLTVIMDRCPAIESPRLGLDTSPG
jgi:predicted CoA-binding protein